MSVASPHDDLLGRPPSGRKLRPRFRSFKTRKPIFYSARWHHDLLVQLTLDPQVQSIDAIEEPEDVGDFRLRVSHGSDDRVLLAVDDTAHRSQPNDETLLVRRSSVLSEPRRSNARSIWSARKVLVSAGDRLRLLMKLSGCPDGMPISELAACVLTPKTDPFEAILSLACRGLTIMDLHRPLAPETKVRRSPDPPAVPDG